MRGNSFVNALTEHLREALAFLRERISAPPESVYWQGFVGQFLRELVNLPSFGPVMEIISKDRLLSQSFLCYPLLQSEAGDTFPTEKAGELFFVHYLGPFLKRYVLDEQVTDYFWDFSEERFTRLWKDLEDYAYLPRIKLLFTVPLIADFKMPPSIIDLGGNLKIRRFERHEQQRWSRFRLGLEFEEPKHALEWRVDCAKDEAYEFAGAVAINTLSKAVACLRVLGADVWSGYIGYAEWPLVFTWEYPAGVIYAHELMMPRTTGFFIIPETFELTEMFVEEYQRIWVDIRGLPDTSRLSLALSRLNDCYSRFRSSDSFIDAWIGLDALAGQEGQEMGYAISTRLSFLIANAFHQRSREADVIRKDMKKSYKERGAIMHPRPRSSMSEKKLRALAEQATNWLRQGIRSAIKCGYTQDIPQQIDAAIFDKALPS